MEDKVGIIIMPLAFSTKGILIHELSHIFATPFPKSRSIFEGFISNIVIDAFLDTHNFILTVIDYPDFLIELYEQYPPKTSLDFIVWLYRFGAHQFELGK